MWTSEPQIPQCVIRISTSVSVNGFGSKGRYSRGEVAEWAIHPWKVDDDDDDDEEFVDAILMTVCLEIGAVSCMYAVSCSLSKDRFLDWDTAW